MQASFVYMPAFRVRTIEWEVLKYFDFGDRICPYIEIIKEKDRPRKMSSSTLYRAMIQGIRSKSVFVDIPFQFMLKDISDPAVINYLTAMRNVDHRINTLLSFASLQKPEKMIPIISSYFFITGTAGTVAKQVEKLRPTFSRLAFRITAKDPEFESELESVESFLTAADHLIVDFEESALNMDKENIKELGTRLSKIQICPVVILRSALPVAVKYKDLNNNEEVIGSDNKLLRQFKTLGASAFGDYAGIKKDLLRGAGGSDKITYGCIYYDATNNQYIGFKGAGPGYKEIKESIVPAVLDSVASQHMLESPIPYLDERNKGWKFLRSNYISRPRDVKKFSIEHYLHCVRAKIEAGNFN